MTGVLSEGQRLVERDLCEMLDVSRNTLREAYRQLEAEGFIDIRPHKGPTVARISLSDAADLYEMREALEGTAIRLFTIRADEHQLQQLDDSFERLRSLPATDILDVLSEKETFYDILYAGASNKVLEKHARVLRGRLAQLRAKSLAHDNRAVNMLGEIEVVLTHIRRRDSDKARDSWCEHIRAAAAAAAASIAAREGEI